MNFGRAMPAYSELGNGIRRIVAPNPSMMTGPGTNTYVLGEREVAVIDPGPDIPEHIENILSKTNSCLRWIIATHTHPDHSPGVLRLATASGAAVLGIPAPAGAHQDQTFAPTEVLAEGDVLDTDEFTVQVLHTPGHASNHLCFRHAESNGLFTGDHVIDGSTVVIDPPDGDMLHYIESLKRCRDLDCAMIFPGHGDVIHNPRAVIDWIIENRLEREAKIVVAMQKHDNLTTHELVPYVYKDVDVSLFGWAERSLLAHVLKLEADGRAKRNGDRWRLIDT